jgi:hypothetical protein
LHFFSKKVHHNNGHTKRLGQSDKFTFRRGQDNFSLKLGCPDDWASTIANDISRPGLRRRGIIHGIFPHPISGEVTIDMHFERLGGIWMKNQALIFGSKEVATEVFDSVSMGLFWITGKTSALVDSISDLGASRFLKKVELADYRSVVPCLHERRSIKVTTKNR